jgi:hypothetical protein
MGEGSGGDGVADAETGRVELRAEDGTENVGGELKGDEEGR